MYDNSAHPLLDHLQRSPALREILTKISQLAAVKKQLCEHLDPQWNKMCNLADFCQGILTLSVSSPAVGHRLQFQVPTLLEQLKSHPFWKDLTHIQVLVRPEDKAPQLPTQEPMPLSSENAEHILSLAKNIDCPSLEKSLKKLASRFTLQSQDTDK